MIAEGHRENQAKPSFSKLLGASLLGCFNQASNKFSTQNSKSLKPEKLGEVKNYNTLPVGGNKVQLNPLKDVDSYSEKFQAENSFNIPQKQPAFESISPGMHEPSHSLPKTTHLQKYSGIQGGISSSDPPPLDKVHLKIDIYGSPFREEMPPEEFIGPIRLYNGETPFVVVDLGHDNPVRGDSHGAIGIARRVSEKVRARMEIIDNNILADLYPELKDHPARLTKFFEEKGYPDFMFSRSLYGVPLSKEGREAGVLINDINESLAGGMLTLEENSKYNSRHIVPHHLTPGILEEEGRRFAEEFGELPRPFIAINFIDLGQEHFNNFLKAMNNIKQAYSEATFFICGCHRTNIARLDEMAVRMKELMGDDGCFPVITFDYATMIKNNEASDFWNIYRGMLDQADHLIQLGSSMSIFSEALSTGKKVHMMGRDLWNTPKSPFVKHLEIYEAGAPLVTDRIKPIDMTGAIAQAIIEQHRHYMREITVSLPPESCGIHARYCGTIRRFK